MPVVTVSENVNPPGLLTLFLLNEMSESKLIFSLNFMLPISADPTIESMGRP